MCVVAVAHSSRRQLFYCSDSYVSIKYVCRKHAFVSVCFFKCFVSGVTCVFASRI